MVTRMLFNKVTASTTSSYCIEKPKIVHKAQAKMFCISRFQIQPAKKFLKQHKASIPSWRSPLSLRCYVQSAFFFLLIIIP